MDIHQRLEIYFQYVRTQRQPSSFVPPPTATQGGEIRSSIDYPNREFVTTTTTKSA